MHTIALNNTKPSFFSFQPKPLAEPKKVALLHHNMLHVSKWFCTEQQQCFVQQRAANIGASNTLRTYTVLFNLWLESNGNNLLDSLMFRRAAQFNLADFSRQTYVLRTGDGTQP